MSFPVPLVPLSEENEDAMEHRGFRALLREVGLRPPANEQVMPPSPSLSPLLLAQPTESPLCPQESFWRIPAALTPQQLRRAAASITPPSPQGPPQELPQRALPPQELPAAPQDHPAGGEGVGWGSGSRVRGAGTPPESLSLCPTAEPLPSPLGSDSER